MNRSRRRTMNLVRIYTEILREPDSQTNGEVRISVSYGLFGLRVKCKRISRVSSYGEPALLV